MKLKDFEHTGLEYRRNGNLATLSRSTTITLYTDKGKIKILAKKGFQWNGNSGSFPCRFSKDNERYNVIILVHDILYTKGSNISKSDADDILRGGLRECGYGRVMAGLIHKGVQIFGNKAYGTDEYDNYEDNMFEVSYVDSN